MCEIRPEAHIKCKAVSEDTVMPGVVSMIREAKPEDIKYQSGNASIDFLGSNVNFTLAAGFEPQKIFLQGYRYVYKYSNPYTYNRYYTLALMCDFETKKFESVVMMYMRRTGGNSSAATHSSSHKEGAGEFDYTINDDGTVTISIPSSELGGGYVTNEMEPRFYLIGL